MKRFALVITVLALSAPLAGANDPATRTTTLSGAEEVPAGDPDGTGSASIEIRPKEGRICWAIKFSKISAPSAAHIHIAAKGANGPPVLPLSPIGKGCAKAEPELIKALLADPNGYYVNVHTAEHPEGAIRGQLTNQGQNY